MIIFVIVAIIQYYSTRLYYTHKSQPVHLNGKSQKPTRHTQFISKINLEDNTENLHRIMDKFTKLVLNAAKKSILKSQESLKNNTKPLESF